MIRWSQTRSEKKQQWRNKDKVDEQKQPVGLIRAEWQPEHIHTIRKLLKIVRNTNELESLEADPAVRI